MPQPGESAGRYEVHISGAISRTPRRIQRQASSEGRGQATLAAFRQIVQRLQDDPLHFGEPLYRLPALRLRIRHAAIRPLFIDFGVYQDKPLVFVRGVTLLSK
jgi:hypothetical protein